VRQTGLEQLVASQHFEALQRLSTRSDPIAPLGLGCRSWRTVPRSAGVHSWNTATARNATHPWSSPPSLVPADHGAFAFFFLLAAVRQEEAEIRSGFRGDAPVTQK
jgi:hypothetical protein